MPTLKLLPTHTWNKALLLPSHGGGDALLLSGAKARKYSDDQERDESGRFAGAGGGGRAEGPSRWTPDVSGATVGGTGVEAQQFNAAVDRAAISGDIKEVQSFDARGAVALMPDGRLFAGKTEEESNHPAIADAIRYELDQAGVPNNVYEHTGGFARLVVYPGDQIAVEAQGGLNHEQAQTTRDVLAVNTTERVFADVAGHISGLHVDDRAWLERYLESKGHQSVNPAHLELKARWAKRVDATATKWEGEATAAARAALEADMREVLALLGGAKGKAKQAKASIDWEEFKLDVSNYMQGGANGNWRSEFRKVLEGVITDQGNSMITEFGLRFDVPNIGAEDWFDEYTMTFAQPINATTESVISEVIQQGVRSGWSIDTMQGHLEEVFQQWLTGELTQEDFKWYSDRMPAYRLETIARTETMHASNAGTMALANEWGIVERKEWLGTGDSRIRPDHEDAWQRYSEGGDPGPIPMDEPFVMDDGSELMFPGDTSLGADLSQICNCRCTWVPWFSENAGETTIDRQGTA